MGALGALQFAERQAVRQTLSEARGLFLISTLRALGENARSLEGFGDKAPRRMVAQRQNPAYRFPYFSDNKAEGTISGVRQRRNFSQGTHKIPLS